MGASGKSLNVCLLVLILSENYLNKLFGFYLDL